MSDVSDDTPEEREAAHTSTDLIRFPAPSGPILYAEVTDEGHLVGYVWITQRVEARPRAGIMLLPTSVIAPSLALQRDLGPLTLDLDRTMDPFEWMDYLESTRDGNHRLNVGPPSTAGSLGALRTIAGYAPN